MSRIFVDTVGKNAKKIQEYIANQLQEDLEYDPDDTERVY
ncbi:hypothetical protein RUMOBE_01289 [Blautia obeum ATCC 29174]|uniref:Transposase IS200-like domain-containing protein n=1 Tax=Blautia obeum ATCC 29174 TaxID=411459 RepID=A5ZQL9_9FIRM|nr:hypothetical protein RUMOBE_01289 [Blautia obeum ATCC 29174]